MPPSSRRATNSSATCPVFGNADDAPGQVALEFVARREEGGMRTAVAERHAKALRVADGDVRAPFAWGREQCERQEIGRDRHQRPPPAPPPPHACRGKSPA